MVTNFITKCLFDLNNDDSSMKAQWTRYYVEVLISSISKTIQVFIAAVILGVFPLTLSVYVSFCIIRTTALGWHASTSGYCSFQSIFFFAFVPFFLKGFVLYLGAKLMISLLFVGLVFKYAPQCTGASECLNKLQKKQMKKKALLKALFLAVALLYFSGDTALMISIAMGIQMIMLVPITKKLVVGKEK